MNRREFITSGVAAGVLPLIGSPIKSMIAGSETVMKEGWDDVSVLPYIQDGLIAMWDGIENAGMGVHDPNAPIWKDLTGNGWDFPATNMMFGDNYATISANIETDKRSSDFWNWNNASFDGVWERSIPLGSAANNGFFRLGRIGHINTNNSNGNAFGWYSSATNRNWRAIYLTGNGGRNKFNFGYRAGVFDLNSSSKDDQKAYVNGNMVTMSNETWTQTIVHADLSMLLFVGNYGQPKYYSLRLYSRALTADEIAHNYEIDKVRFNLP